MKTVDLFWQHCAVVFGFGQVLLRELTTTVKRFFYKVVHLSDYLTHGICTMNEGIFLPL